MKYGDYDNVTKDVKVLNDILNRQGYTLLMEVIAEHFGYTVNKLNLSQTEIDNSKEHVLLELKTEINERI